MKKFLLIAFTVMLCGAGAFAKTEKKVVFTVEPKMHCQNCINNITEALRFEKGVSDVVCSLKDQTVTVTYDADKNNPKNFEKALSKAKYTATIDENLSKDDKAADKKHECSNCASTDKEKEHKDHNHNHNHNHNK